MDNSNLRYTVGETYPFLLLKTNTNGFINTRSYYMPGEDGNTIVELKVIPLICKEHHEVPVVYGQPDDVAHGFIFEDAESNRWFNQYPRAHYGQINDTMDWRVRAENLNPLPHNKENEPTTQLRDLRIYLETLERDIYMLQHDKNPAVKDAASALVQHRNQIVLEANQALHKSVIIKEATLDDKPFEGFFDVTFE